MELTWVTVLLATVKYLGLIVTAGLGIYGVTHEFRRDGVLTPAGRRAIALMLGASLLAIVAAALEQYQSYVESRERKVAESLQRPFRDLRLAWPVASEGARLFEAALRQAARSGTPASDQVWITYIAGALQHGTLSVAKSDHGWRLKVSLHRPQNEEGEEVSKEFDETTGEWKAFRSAMQHLIGEYFDLSLTSGARIAELGSAE